MITVATAGGQATNRAGIIVLIVTVIAFLALLDATITTTGQSTEPSAAIAIDLITVITGLDALLNEAITTARFLAIGGTGVAGDAIAVVAGLARLSLTIAAASLQAKASRSLTVPALSTVRIGIAVSCFTEIRLGAGTEQKQQAENRSVRSHHDEDSGKPWAIA